MRLDAVSEHHGFPNPAGSVGRVWPDKGKGQEILTLPNPYPYKRPTGMAGGSLATTIY